MDMCQVVVSNRRLDQLGQFILCACRDLFCAGHQCVLDRDGTVTFLAAPFGLNVVPALHDCGYERHAGQLDELPNVWWGQFLEELRVNDFETVLPSEYRHDNVAPDRIEPRGEWPSVHTNS